MAKSKKEEKILRVGIVQGGRIIEERLLRSKEPVTIGQSPKNKFMIPSPRVPFTYTLLNVHGGAYHLEFEKGMLGKVLVGQEILDLKTIAQRKVAERRKNRFSMKLLEESRGKIVLGDVTLLFQFVTAPPAVARLQLPAEARGAWWRNMDRAFMLCFLVTMMLLGGSGGGLDVWWRQTGRYRPYRVTTKTSELFSTLIEAKKQEEEKKEKPESTEGAEADEGISEGVDDSKRVERAVEDNDRIAEGSDEFGGMGAEEPGLGDQDVGLEDVAGGIDSDAIGSRLGDQLDTKMPEAAPVSASDRVGISRQLVREKTVVSVMGSMYGEGVMVNDTTGGRYGRSRDASAFGSLAIGSGQGVTSDYLVDEEGGGGGADAELAAMREGRLGGPGGLGGGGGPLIPPPEVKAVKGPDSAEEIKGPAKKIERTTAKVEERKFKLELSQARGFTGKIDQGAVTSTLRRKQSAFNRCYIKAARKNPDVGGKITIKITIDTSGRAKVAIQSNRTGSDELGECIKSSIESWGFPRPDDGRPASFTIPLMFRKIQ